jgi:hypothetical protein
VDVTTERGELLELREPDHELVSVDNETGHDTHNTPGSSLRCANRERFRLRYGPHMLVVMPNGFGLYGPGDVIFWSFFPSATQSLNGVPF